MGAHYEVVGDIVTKYYYAGSNTYTYDANGNQTKRVVDGQTMALEYDAENRLVKVCEDTSNDGVCDTGETVKAEFIYDGDGRRVKSIMGNEIILFVGGHYEINDTTDEVTKYYFAGTTRIAMRKYTIPQPMTVEYFLGDHLGSTSLSVNADTGEAIETRYKPWGEVRYTTPDKTLPTQYTFTGQYSHIADEATDLGSSSFGLMFYNARWYDPALGRFTQADTIVPGGAQGLDRYAYVNNSPVNYIDPSGHSQCQTQEDCEDMGTTPMGEFEDPVFLTEDAQDLIKLSEQVGLSPMQIIKVGLAHELSGWASDEGKVELYSQYLSNRFVWWAKWNCSSQTTYNCFLNYAVATHQTIKTSFIKNYLGNPEMDFVFNEITNWSSTYLEAANTVMDGFWQGLDQTYDPDVNVGDRDKPFNTGIIPQSQLDNALIVHKIPEGQFGSYFLIFDKTTCGRIASYSVILSYDGDQYFQDLKNLGLAGLTNC